MKDPEFIQQMVAKGKTAGTLINNEFGCLSVSDINKQPTAGSWSIAQCIDHIIISDALYFPIFKKINEGEYKMNVIQRWSPMNRFFGNMMEHYISERVHRKIKSPRKFLPSSDEYTKDILLKYDTHLSLLIEHIERFSEIDIDKIIISSRVSSLVTYSVRTAINIIIHHQLRHIHQAARIKKKTIL